MRYEMFTIHDVKAEAFMPPFVQANQNTAKRQFAEAVNNPDTPIGKHPQDYTLFSIGHYSEAKGEIKTHDKLTVGNGMEFLNSE